MKCHDCGYKTFFDWTSITCPKCERVRAEFVAIYHENPGGFSPEARQILLRQEGNSQSGLGPPENDDGGAATSNQVAAASSFEVSARILTSSANEDILAALAAQFVGSAESVGRVDERVLVVKQIEPTFGSINRSDTTHIEIRPRPNGVLLVASTHYSPSGWFWILSLVLLFTAVGWLFPIGFYLLQKRTVQARIERIFARVQDEFQSAPAPQPPVAQHSSSGGSADELAQMELLERLGDLLQRGVLTQEEFQAKKRQILGDLMAPTDPPSPASEPADDEDTQ